MTFIILRQTAEQKSAVEKLRALTDLINQTVGDALSDLLLVEAILTNRQWTFKQWDQAYTDLPNRLVKVVVSSITMIYLSCFFFED